MKSPLFKHSMPSAMIFDWDNTLIDSWPSIMTIINQTRAQFGLKIWSLEEIKINCTRAARDSFPEWFGSRWEEAYDYYYTHFNDMRKTAAIQALPGAQELLEWLSSQKIPTFIVSNKRGDFLRLEVKKARWQNHFIAVVGSSDAPRDKPDRAHVDYALSAGKLTANEAIWFIGDSETDVLCARNSGCTPVLINHPDEAKKLGVSISFPDCAALLEVLKKY